MDYAKRARQGFLVGAVLFVVGALGELLAHTVVTLPEREQTLLLDAVILGTLVALLGVFVFGIVLPLVE
ncbi:MAG: hypothetical protein BRD23_07480 [Halobacteriales archaeon SW_9_67_25]|nr:MAG: hypothetical protein BRD23_07480 [Halobacteriales archaeon SW_9_67_25]